MLENHTIQRSDRADRAVQPRQPQTKDGASASPAAKAQGKATGVSEIFTDGVQTSSPAKPRPEPTGVEKIFAGHKPDVQRPAGKEGLLKTAVGDCFEAVFLVAPIGAVCGAATLVATGPADIVRLPCVLCNDDRYGNDEVRPFGITRAMWSWFRVNIKGEVGAGELAEMQRGLG